MPVSTTAHPVSLGEFHHNELEGTISYRSVSSVCLVLFMLPMIPVGVTGVKYLAKLFVKEILAKRLQSSESRGRVILMINKYLNKNQRIEVDYLAKK